MSEKLERVIADICRRRRPPQQETEHPDEQVVALFVDGRLPADDERAVKSHLNVCAGCAAAAAQALKAAAMPDENPPEELLRRVGGKIIAQQECLPVIQLVVKAHERIIEIVSAAGDCIVGQELVPASVLRSRHLTEFRNTVTILKNFGSILVEARIENKDGRLCRAAISVKDMETQKAFTEARITLMKDGVELESYVAAAGVAAFDDVVPGAYRIEISTPRQKLAAFALEVQSV